MLIMAVEKYHCIHNPTYNICTKLHHLARIIPKDEKIVCTVEPANHLLNVGEFFLKVLEGAIRT